MYACWLVQNGKLKFHSSSTHLPSHSGVSAQEGALKFTVEFGLPNCCNSKMEGFALHHGKAFSSNILTEETCSFKDAA
jgi:hypothetical protein